MPLSLIFVFISAVILLGVGSSFSPAACSGGIWLCIILYAGSKVVLYVLLLEKLYIVHSHTATGRISRRASFHFLRLAHAVADSSSRQSNPGGIEEDVCCCWHGSASLSL